jgi:hypothetical protein
MSSPERKPDPPVSLEAFLDDLDAEEDAEELARLSKLTRDELLAELKAEGIPLEPGRAAARRALAMHSLLADESLKHLATLSPEELRAEIVRAGLDPRKVHDRVHEALASWRAAN